MLLNTHGPRRRRAFRRQVKQHNEWRSAWLKRKRGFRECVDVRGGARMGFSDGSSAGAPTRGRARAVPHNPRQVLAENMDLKPKAVIKAVADAQDVETDEDAGVTLPPPDPLPVPK